MTWRRSRGLWLPRRLVPPALTRTPLGAFASGAGGGAASFALDGTPQTASGTTAALALPGFTTTNGNVIVYIGTTTNGGPITSITGASLTWAQRAGMFTGNAGEYTELWYAKSSSALSGAVFTINNTSSAFIGGTVFAFSGAAFASPFDTNASIPETTPGGTSLSFSTDNANDILVIVGRGTGGADPPYTQVASNANFVSAGYRSVTATQSPTSILWAGGGAFYMSIADAIMQGP